MRAFLCISVRIRMCECVYSYLSVYVLMIRFLKPKATASKYREAKRVVYTKGDKAVHLYGQRIQGRHLSMRSMRSLR